MGTGDASSCNHHALNALGKEASVGYIVGDDILNLVFSLSGSVGIMDVNNEFSLVYGDIREFLTFVTTCLSYSGSGSAADASAILVSWKSAVEEIHQQRDLTAQFKISREDIAHFGHIHFVRLCGINLPLPLSYSRVEAYCSEMSGNFSFISASLAEIKKSLTV